MNLKSILVSKIDFGPMALGYPVEPCVDVLSHSVPLSQGHTLKKHLIYDYV